MKNMFKKLLIVLFLALMLINSSLLIIISVAVDEVQRLIDKSNVNLTYSMDLEKYVNYSLDGQNKGLLVQLNLKSLAKYENVENVTNAIGIVLNLPKINGEYPQNVEVLSKSDEKIQKDYDKEKGILQVVELENDQCEYTVVINYSQNCYTKDEIKRTLKFSGKVLAQLANEEKETIITNIDESYDVDKNISNLITTSLETTDIYNGFINSNKENGTKYVTDYTENLDIDVGYKEIADEVRLELNNKFISGDKFLDTNEIIYKSTKVNKNEVLSKLGEDGTLKILNSNGEVLGEVNKDTETQEDGTIEFNYENEIAELEIVMSKPIQLGKINIQNNRQIKDTVINVEDNKIIENHLIQGINNVEIINGENTEITKEEIYKFESTYATEIKDAETRVDLSIDKTEWTNNIQNDVIFTAVLVTDSEKNSLFKNPVIEIELPKEVEKVILGDINLLYDDNLSIRSVNVIEKNNNKVIRVELDGIQNAYIQNDLIKGAEIVLLASVMVKKDVQSIETNIKYTYTNELNPTLDYEKEGKEAKECNINVLSVNNNDDVSIASIEPSVDEYIELPSASESQTGVELKVVAKKGDTILSDGDAIYEHEYVKYEIKLKNNTDSKIENINLVGSVPEGTTYVDCYFGEVVHPNDYDLYKIKENSDVSQYTKIIDLDAGEEKDIDYYVRANYLDVEEYEKNIESKIYIEKDGTKIDEYTLNNKIKTAEMELSLRAWETDRADNLWLYEIKITNNTDNDINNVVANMNLSDEIKFSYIEDYVTEYNVEESVNGININIPKIDAKTTQKIELFMQVTGTNEKVFNYEISTCVSAKGNKTNTYYSNINKQNAHMAGIQVIQTSQKEGKYLEYDEEVEYDFVIKNISDKDIRKEAVSLQLINYVDKNLVPISVEYEYYDFNEQTYQYEKKTGTKDISSKFIADGVDASSVADLYLILAIPTGKEVNVKLKCKAGEVNENTEVSNCLKVVYDYLGAHTVTSNIIKNTILPRYPDNPDNPDKPDTPDNPDKPDTPDNPNDPDNPDELDVKYSISGLAWEDANRNGKLDNDEKKLSNITVKLFNSETNAIVKGQDGNNFEVLTDNDGKYSFDNVEKGKYIVVFEYDDNNYALTAYKKKDVSEDINSDVIKKQALIDGVEKIVAVTDILNIENSNIAYINIGLIKNEIFDLSLNKSISKVVFKYDGFNKEYNYDNVKLAKVEVPSKKISSASVDVEYLIEVKNEGDVNAYVDEIVDYIPEGFTFDSELNDGWYSSANGILKNVSYAGVIIKPGESKTIKLCLTRTLTSDTIGILKNSAEIFKSSSVNGGTDIDSISGNKVESEDDYSSADLIISVKTGALLYTSIFGLMIIILLIFKLFIDKKIINIKKIKMFSIALVLIGAVCIGNYSICGDASVASYDSWSYETAKQYVKDHYLPSSNGSVGCYFTTYTDHDSSNSGYDWTVTGDTYYSHIDGTNTSSTCSNIYCSHDYAYTEYRHHKTVNYVHHDATSSVSGLTRAGGALYCTDAKDMSSSAPGWSYSFSSLSDITISSVAEESRKEVATITDNGSSPKFDGCTNSGEDSNYYLVGPYNVNYSGNITGISVKARKQSNSQEYDVNDYKIVDANNNEISITSGVKFYLRVNKSVTWISKVHIDVAKEGYIKYKIAYTYKELWKCNESNSQVLGKDGSKDDFITEWIPTQTSNQIDLDGVKLPLGKLKIHKVDYDTNAILKGYKITVTNQKYYFKKTITIGENEEDSSLPSSPFRTTYSNGTITISGLPAGTTYTIEEIKTPYEYKLDLQAEDWINKTVNIEENNTISIELKDRKYGDLRITKIDKDTYKKMNGVGFIIFRQTSDGTKYYLQDYYWRLGEPAHCTWTTNEVKADVFYTGEIASVDNSGYTHGNSSTSVGTVVLQDLPLYYDGQKITYNIQEYKFDYDYNPDLMYYKLDRTIVERIQLISESYTNHNNRTNQLNLLRNVTIDFYNSDYVKKYTKSNGDSFSIIRGIYRTITGIEPTGEEISYYMNILQWNDGYSNLGQIAETIYSAAWINTRYYGEELTNKMNEYVNILNNRVIQIYSSDDSIKSYTESLIGNIGITGDNVKQSMKDYCVNRLKCQTVVIVRNKQYVIDIRGTVWEDIASSKLTLRNNIYDDDDGDENENHDLPAKDVTVRLFAELNPDGQLPTLAAKTDTNGKYRFKGSQFIYRNINGRIYQEFEDNNNKTVYVSAVYNSSTDSYEIDKNSNGIPKSVLNSNGNALTVVSYENSSLQFKNSNGTLKSAIPKVHMNIIINNLSQYNIEFEYNGLRYECVLTEKEKNGSNDNNYIYKEVNSSKAKENTTNRQNFNNTYSRISGGNAKNTSNYTTIGYSTNDSRNNENKLTYTGDNTKSELVQNTKYSVESAANSVSNSNLPGMGVVMTSTTKEAKCNFKDMYELLPEGSREIENVNLGLYEREQPDLALQTDIDNVQFSINGYTHTYNYKKRASYENQTGVPDSEVNPGYDAAMDGFSVSVKRNNNYKQLSYERSVYDSYIAYTNDYYQGNNTSHDKLRMFVTYKITVTNQSSSLINRVRLRNYADARYTSVYSSKIVAKDGNEIDIKDKWINKGSLNNGKTNYWETEDLLNTNIYAGSTSNPSTITVYLTYEISTETISGMISLNENNDSVEFTENTTEIIEYSTWDKNGKVYAGIDKDSAPNNMTYMNINTYEDDTDAAPGFKLSRKSSKVISGLVFEDDTGGNNLKTSEERKGDGTYKNENTVEGVEVNIKTYGQNPETIKLYNINEQNQLVITNAQDLTESKGKYEFTGLVPGEYYIEYTYGKYKYTDTNSNSSEEDKQTKIGNKEITTQNYKSTIVNKKFEKLIEDINSFNETGTNYYNDLGKNQSDGLCYWYENSENFNLSSAVDDGKMRETINSNLSKINNDVKTKYESKTDSADNHYIKAYTGIMDWAVEDYGNQTTNDGEYVEGSREYQIKFGIAERPRQSLQVNKEISKMCLTLANGQILAQGDPRNDTIRYVTYPDGGTLKIEADNEIIEGSTLDLEYEITIEDRSELDYDAFKYYRYGDTTGLSPVKIKLDSIVDYVDEKLSITYDVDDSQNSDFVYYDQSKTVKNKWQIIKEAEGNNKLAGISIDSNVYNATKNRSNIVVRNTDIEISPLDSKPAVLTLSTKKLLTNLNENQEFDNYTELIQVSNSVGRFYGQMKSNIFKLETPGNFNIKKISYTDESDNSNYSRWNVWKKNNAKVIIVPPTGAKDIIIYVLIGLGCLIILSGGIILIKKKVLD